MRGNEPTTPRVNGEIRAIRVAIACAVSGVLTKAIVGTMTGSMTIISSAVDSAGDLMVSVANLFVVRLSDREPDEDHKYGHTKVEGLGAMFEGGFIIAAALFIIYEAIHKAMIGEVSHDSALGIAVMVPLLASCTFATLRARPAALSSSPTRSTTPPTSRSMSACWSRSSWFGSQASR